MVSGFSNWMPSVLPPPTQGAKMPIVASFGIIRSTCGSSSFAMSPRDAVASTVSAPCTFPKSNSSDATDERKTPWAFRQAS